MFAGCAPRSDRRSPNDSAPIRQTASWPAGAPSAARTFGCQVEQLEARQMMAHMVADFSLIDVNATSSSYNQPVSPRDFVGQVSGWYFGQAT
jgi:hypothetical protein